MIKELVAQYGIENVVVEMYEAPLSRTTVGGLTVCFTSSNTKDLLGEFHLVEERYKIDNNYKVEFAKYVTKDGYVLSPGAMYISDLEAMINQGVVKVRVANISDIE